MSRRPRALRIDGSSNASIREVSARSSGVVALHGVGQAVRVLENIAAHGAGVTLGEATRALGMPKPTVFRALHTWLRLGYLERDSGGRYRLGWKPFELTAQHIEGANLREVAREYIRRVHEESTETIHLSVLDGTQVLYVDKLEGRQPIRVYTAMGSRGPLHATASGKAVLAFQPEEFLARFIKVGPPRYTALTIVAPAALRREMSAIRRRGYAVNRGEWHAEVAGVGAPIFDANGTVRSALSATLPVLYLSRKRVEFLTHLLTEAAAAMSRRLGYAPRPPSIAKAFSKESS